MMRDKEFEMKENELRLKQEELDRKQSEFRMRVDSHDFQEELKDNLMKSDSSNISFGSSYRALMESAAGDGDLVEQHAQLHRLEASLEWKEASVFLVMCDTDDKPRCEINFNYNKCRSK